MEYYVFQTTIHLFLLTSGITLEQVNQFAYLGCSVSYQFSNKEEFKLAKFLQIIGTIKRTIFRKVRMKTILKIYNTLVVAYIFIWVRKLD